jgi:hypothetical protein
MKEEEENSMDEVTPRTMAQVIDGVVPGVEWITLGGVRYAAKEPDFVRNSQIMVLQGQQSDLQKNTKLTDAERMRQLNEIMSGIVRCFSAEIESDWPRIEANATLEEILQALEAIGLIVNRPFLKRALAAPPAVNRKARREKSKK